MKKSLFFLSTFILVVALMTVSCAKKEESSQGDSANEPFSFINLSALKSVLEIGGSTTVTATATGTGLTYHWKASAGDILGSGNKITYTAASCCAGVNVISCTVEDNSNNSKELSIYITIN